MVKTVDDQATDERYGISELAEAAGVSVRTVRYYIAEGLLPPPHVAGAKSTYTREHLSRLRVIGRLKDAFLPLKEIRRQLAAMDAAAIQELADEADAPTAPPSPPPAARYVAEELSAFEVSPRSARAPARASRKDEPDPESAARYIKRVLQESAHRPAAPATPRPLPPRPPMHPGPDDSSTAWRRITLGDGAELLIRDEVYQRLREKVDWLVSWARKVFD